MTTIADQIVRIQTAIANAYTACQDMGATMPLVQDSDHLEACIASISGGGSSATVLHLYDRVDDKATVAGFWTDGNGQRYAVCVADAAYRQRYISWGGIVDTSLPNYSSASAALTASGSGTWNTDTIINNYTPTDYPAFNVARNALTITVDNQTFTSCLPNAAELLMVSGDYSTLDTYDPTVSQYSSNSLDSLLYNNFHCWSSTEYNSRYAWYYSNNAIGYSLGKTTSQNFGVCPIIEIPVDENGEVQ